VNLIKKNSTDVARYMMLVDPSTGVPETGLTITALTMQYTRNLTAAASSETAAAGSTTAHSDNTIVEIDGTDSPGLYKVDWPDAAFATGVDKVVLVVSGAAIAPAVEEIQLVAFDPEDAVRLGLTALPNAAADANNGLVTGDGSVTFTAGAGNRPAVDVEAISGSTTEADNLEAALPTADGIDINMAKALDSTPTDDTVGDALWKATSTLRMLRTTAAAGSTASVVNLTAVPGTDANDDYNGHLLVCYDASDGDRPSLAVISDYVAASNVCTLSTDLLFTPQAATDKVEIWSTSDTAVLEEITKLSTGFGSTSPDTLQAYLEAMMDKTASNPAAVGTYNAATDSQEAIRELLDTMAGSGFATGTDSLKAIRDAIDTLVAPSVVSSSALSGSGFLSDCVSWVRKHTDEPGTTPKYTDGDIVDIVSGAFDVVIADININTDHPILVRTTISIVSGQQYYRLPPQVAEVWRIAKLDSDVSTMLWNMHPGSYYNFSGYGFKLEGNSIRLLRDWKESESLELLFVPNGEVYMHKATGVPTGSLVNTTYKWTASGAGTNEYYCELDGGGDPSLSEPTQVNLGGSSATEGTLGSLAAGTWGYGDNDTLGYSTVYVRLSGGTDPDAGAIHNVQTGTGNQLTFASSVTDGTLDTRENAYAGYMLRVLSDDNTIVQERIITAYSNTTRVATLSEPLSPLGLGTLTYEVVPQYSRLLRQVVSLRAAIDLLANEGNAKRIQTLTAAYAVKMSALRRHLSKKESRFPGHMDGDTEDNMNRGGFWGGIV
jgi:hypothetical protein